MSMLQLLRGLQPFMGIDIEPESAYSTRWFVSIAFWIVGVHCKAKTKCSTWHFLKLEKLTVWSYWMEWTTIWTKNRFKKWKFSFIHKKISACAQFWQKSWPLSQNLLTMHVFDRTNWISTSENPCLPIAEWTLRPWFQQSINLEWRTTSVIIPSRYKSPDNYVVILYFDMLFCQNINN